MNHSLVLFSVFALARRNGCSLRVLTDCVTCCTLCIDYMCATTIQTIKKKNRIETVQLLLLLPPFFSSAGVYVSIRIQIEVEKEESAMQY